MPKFTSPCYEPYVELDWVQRAFQTKNFEIKEMFEKRLLDEVPGRYSMLPSSLR